MERWCIDYIASTKSVGNENDVDIMPQLRQVCKRVVVLLRTVHSLARMLPTYQLHRRINSVGPQHTSSKGAYYYQQHRPVPLSHATGNGSNGGESLSFSIYETTQHLSNDSGDGRIPPNFQRQDFTPVPTPFGMLQISLFYSKTPELIEQRPTQAISIASAPRETLCDVPKSQNSSGPSSYVSDYIIPDYATEQSPPVTQPNVNISHTEGEMSLKRDKLSGLSLALLNQCQVSSNQTDDVASGPSKSYERPSSARNRMGNVNNNASRSHGDRHEDHARSYDVKPRSILNQNAVYSSSLSSKISPSYNNAGDIDDNANEQDNIRIRTGDNGYGHNGRSNSISSNLKLVVPMKHLIAPGSATSQQQYALASTPPFSSKLQQNFLNNSIPKSISASPPFHSRPLGFHNTENTGVTLSSTPPPYEANTLQQILQPPTSLEVLPMSPFKADSHSLYSSHSAQPPLYAVDSGNEPYHSLPFAGSFGSAHSSPASNYYGRGEAMYNFHGLSCSSALESAHQRSFYQGSSFEKMPFATEAPSLEVDKNDNSEGSILAETNAASSFAYRCATASRLQMFDAKTENDELDSLGKKNDCSSQRNQEQRSNADSLCCSDGNVGSQLEEFRSFGAILMRSSASAGPAAPPATARVS